MEQAAKGFVGKIIGFHLLLLIMVVATVYLASREIYQSARVQAIEQAKRRQELLSTQTARGIESYYNSILSALDLLQRAEAEKVGGAEQLAPALWEQLEGPISQLIVVDQKTMSVVTRFSQGDDAAADVINGASNWLKTINAPAVSSYQQTARDRDGGVTLVCAPVKTNSSERQLIVAVIPMRIISSRFLTDVNNQRSMTAMLLDENGRIMGADDPTTIGKKVLDDNIDPRIRTSFIDFLKQGKPGSKIFEQPILQNESLYQSAITSLYPIDVPNKKWWLVLSSSFAEVDEVVQTLVKRALVWGAFVIVSVTAILVSTTVQLIRGRIRLERERHEMIAKELTQRGKFNSPGCQGRGGSFTRWISSPSMSRRVTSAATSTTGSNCPMVALS